MFGIGMEEILVLIYLGTMSMCVILPALLHVATSSYGFVFETPAPPYLYREMCLKVAYTRVGDEYAHKFTPNSSSTNHPDAGIGFFMFWMILAHITPLLFLLAFHQPITLIVFPSLMALLWLMRQIVRGGKKAMTKHVAELHVSKAV